MSNKCKILGIINDAIERDCDYIVLQMRVDNSNIDIRSRYFKEEYMHACIDIINKQYDDDLVNVNNESVKIISAVGANYNNTLLEIEDALLTNSLFFDTIWR